MSLEPSPMKRSNPEKVKQTVHAYFFEGGRAQDEGMQEKFHEAFEEHVIGSQDDETGKKQILHGRLSIPMEYIAKADTDLLNRNVRMRIAKATRVVQI